jgi:hypothetical protein
VRPDHQEFTDGVRLAAIAALSAVVTATVVIGAGRAIVPERDAVAAERTAMIAVVSARPAR